MKNGILLCCHGTRSIKGTNDTNKLLKIFKQKNKNHIIKIGYLEIRKPTIEDQLEFFFGKKIRTLLIIPAMIFPGNHVTKDIPKIVNNTKKNYKDLPEIFITKPLIYSMDFFNTVQKNLIKNLKVINRKKKNGLITIASNTINLNAKAKINLLTKKISKKNKFNLYKSILITLNKENLKNKLKNLNLSYEKFLILPIFLFRGKLLENLTSVTKELNKKYKNKFILCKHIDNYEIIYNLVKNLANLKLHKKIVK